MTPLDKALADLREAVRQHDRAFTPSARMYWADCVNECAYRVNIEIHNEFPDQHNHPGPYRPLQHERQQ